MYVTHLPHNKLRGYFLLSLAGLSYRLLSRDFILRMNQRKLWFFIIGIRSSEFIKEPEFDGDFDLDFDG